MHMYAHTVCNKLQKLSLSVSFRSKYKALDINNFFRIRHGVDLHYERSTILFKSDQKNPK